MDWKEVEKKLMEECMTEDYKNSWVLRGAYLRGAYDLFLLLQRIYSDDHK